MLLVIYDSMFQFRMFIIALTGLIIFLKFKYFHNFPLHPSYSIKRRNFL